MKSQSVQIILWKEGKYFVAECLNNNISSFGESKKEALENIHEALELYFENEPEYVLQVVEQVEIFQSSISYA